MLSERDFASDHIMVF